MHAPGPPRARTARQLLPGPQAAVHRDEGIREAGPARMAAMAPAVNRRGQEWCHCRQCRSIGGRRGSGIAGRPRHGMAVRRAAAARPVPGAGGGRSDHDAVDGRDSGTRMALARAACGGHRLDQEINEAFASVVLAWQRELDAKPSRVNPWGGAIARRRRNRRGLDGQMLAGHTAAQLARDATLFPVGVAAQCVPGLNRRRERFSCR